jgi:hypothetical protein
MLGAETSFNMDMKHFNRVLSKYSHLTSKSMVETVNHRAANIAYQSIRFTPKTTPAKIKTEMTAAAKVDSRAPFGAVLVNYWRGQKGKKGLYGRYMKKAVRTATRYRSRGTNFMKAAWYGAIDDLQGHAKNVRKTPRNKRGFRNKGSARPERNTRTKKPFAIVRHGVRFGSDVKPARKALSKAMRHEVRDMATYIRRKLGKEWKKTKTFR